MANRAPLSHDEIAAALVDLPGWSSERDALQKTFEFKDYLAGIAFASAVGVVSEGLDHHPDLHIGWCKVTVRYNTHDAGSKVTAVDVKLAQAVEALPFKGK
jgi:4a-hydroxytetrahydrobiopterin dehydratase